ncbi:hypothetical protein GGF32_006853 [Allomyces javanicus]|nr:hypothetical protein GGF32_006853 [Allomyces javanicus]
MSAGDKTKDGKIHESDKRITSLTDLIDKERCAHEKELDELNKSLDKERRARKEEVDKLNKLLAKERRARCVIIKLSR